MGNFTTPAGPHGREEYGPAAAGLYTSHNCTLSHAQFYAGGSLITVKRNRDAVLKPDTIPSKRGKISGFSKKSRVNLMRKTAKLDRSEKYLFATITFPDEYFDQRLDAKKRQTITRRLYMRFCREYPGGGAILRWEYQRRKSGRNVGEIFPHGHLVVYGVGNLLAFRNWLAVNWWQSCGKLSENHLKAGTSAKIIPNNRIMFSYVSKYMAKIDDLDGLETGRLWTVWNTENLPWVRGLLVQLSEVEAITLIRYMRKYADLHGRDYKALTIFCDAEYWHKRLPEILYPP